MSVTIRGITYELGSSNFTARISSQVYNSGWGYTGGYYVTVSAGTSYIFSDYNTSWDYPVKTWTSSYGNATYAPLDVLPYATYTITYNANGGSGAPSAGTKTWGTTYYISSTVPTRTGYSFLGWSTSSSATTATYTSGSAYTSESGTTLYAVWSPQASIITNLSSSTIVTAGTTTVLNITNYNSSFTNSIYFNINGTETAIVEGLSSSTTTYSWSNTAAIGAQMTTSSSAVGVITIKTYNSNTLIGSNSYNVSFVVNAVPSLSSISCTYAESDEDFENMLVKDYTKAKFTITTAGIYSSTVTNAYVTFGGIQYSGTVSNNSCTIIVPSTNYLSISGTEDYSAYVIDSRGKQSATTTGSVYIADYNTPTVSNFRFTRASDDSVQLYVDYVISAVNKTSSSGTAQNTKTYSLSRAVGSGSSSVISSGDLNDWTASDYNIYTDSTTEAKSTSTTVTYTLSIIDKKQTISVNLSTGIICISRKAGGTGVAFGKDATRDGLDVDWNNSYFKNVILTENKSYGTTIPTSGVAGQIFLKIIE